MISFEILYIFFLFSLMIDIDANFLLILIYVICSYLFCYYNLRPEDNLKHLLHQFNNQILTICSRGEGSPEVFCGSKEGTGFHFFYSRRPSGKLVGYLNTELLNIPEKARISRLHFPGMLKQQSYFVDLEERNFLIPVKQLLLYGNSL